MKEIWWLCSIKWLSWYMLLLLLSCFSRVWICVTPQTAAHQAPPSLGFSRQEHWSGLPFPSPILIHDNPSIGGKWYITEVISIFSCPSNITTDSMRKWIKNKQSKSRNNNGGHRFLCSYLCYNLLILTGLWAGTFIFCNSPY